MAGFLGPWRPRGDVSAHELTAHSVRASRARYGPVARIPGALSHESRARKVRTKTSRVFRQAESEPGVSISTGEAPYVPFKRFSLSVRGRGRRSAPRPRPSKRAGDAARCACRRELPSLSTAALRLCSAVLDIYRVRRVGSAEQLTGGRFLLMRLGPDSHTPSS